MRGDYRALLGKMGWIFVYRTVVKKIVARGEDYISQIDSDSRLSE